MPPWPWVFAPQQRFWCRSHSGDTTTGNTWGQTAQHQNGGRGEGAAAGSLSPPAPDSHLPRKMGYFIAGGAASASKHQILGGWDPPCLVRTQPPAPAVGRSRSGSTGSTRAPTPAPYQGQDPPTHTPGSPPGGRGSQQPTQPRCCERRARGTKPQRGAGAGRTDEKRPGTARTKPLLAPSTKPRPPRAPNPGLLGEQSPQAAVSTPCWEETDAPGSVQAFPVAVGGC